jgi:regulator of protease activity HflC (stomatin/prohibitin superfamily)
MVAITATNSTTQSLQIALGQARLEQARKDADEAEANAKTLRIQADQAEQESENKQNTFQSLTNQTAQAQATYRASTANTASAVPVATQEFLVRLYNATSQQFAAGGNALKSTPNTPSVLNMQGQTTGRILNLSV